MPDFFCIPPPFCRFTVLAALRFEHHLLVWKTCLLMTSAVAIIPPIPTVAQGGEYALRIFPHICTYFAHILASLCIALHPVALLAGGRALLAADARRPIQRHSAPRHRLLRRDQNGGHREPPLRGLREGARPGGAEHERPAQVSASNLENGWTLSISYWGMGTFRDTTHFKGGLS